jgi:hypothetical protein
MQVSGQCHASVVLSLERNPRYALDRRAGGPQSRSERYGENILAVPVIGLSLIA